MKNALRIRRAENFADWYQEVIREADLAENSGVRGCRVLPSSCRRRRRPAGCKVLEREFASASGEGPP